MILSISQKKKKKKKEKNKRKKKKTNLSCEHDVIITEYVLF